MYSARFLGASAARRRTLAGVNRGEPREIAAQESHEGGSVWIDLIGESYKRPESHSM